LPDLHFVENFSRKRFDYYSQYPIGMQPSRVVKLGPVGRFQFQLPFCRNTWCFQMRDARRITMGAAASESHSLLCTSQSYAWRNISAMARPAMVCKYLICVGDAKKGFQRCSRRFNYARRRRILPVFRFATRRRQTVERRVGASRHFNSVFRARHLGLGFWSRMGVMISISRMYMKIISNLTWSLPAPVLPCATACGKFHCVAAICNAWLSRSALTLKARVQCYFFKEVFQRDEIFVMRS